MLHHRYIDAFLDQVTVEYGPAELLTHLFVTASEAAAVRGFHFSYGTFEELVAANETNSDTWPWVTTSFRPDLGGANEENGLVVFGKDLNGQVVTCQAVRRFDWQGTNFKKETEALRLFYAEPNQVRRQGECCIVSVPQAEEISGCVAYAGGLWIHPRLRGGDTMRIVTCVGRASALGRWGFDELISLITPATLSKAFHTRTKVGHIDEKSVIMRNSPSLPDKDLVMSLLRTTPYQLIDDLMRIILQFNAQVDVAPRLGHRQQKQ